LLGSLAPLIAAGLIRVDVAPNGSITTLAAMLRGAETAGRPYHAWHFIGHGRFIAHEGMTFLAFEDTNGMTRMHSGFELGTLLGAHPSLRVAVLNACEAGRTAPEDSLTSVAAALVSRGLAAAVAMQFAISDDAAISFADYFYGTLTDTGSLDAAVSDARRSIFFMPDEREWATPIVLFRTDDGVLFDLRGSGLSLVRG
jgi:CHAT domain-containing protein